MTIFYRDSRVLVYHGDCVETLTELDDCSVDAIVCDPPYGLNFMGKGWDTDVEYQKWCAIWAAQCLRVLKPGGHMLAFGGTRTAHRLTSGIEDAGFEIRDTITWIYASGFPKSLDVSKAIDKAAGAEREVIAEGVRFGRGSMRNRSRVEAGYRPTELNPDGGATKITAPASDDAHYWQGWGTALKPASEPIVLARKPFAGTVAGNVLAHGTGALNIDGCRVEADWSTDPTRRGWQGTAKSNSMFVSGVKNPNTSGRWPSNLVFSHDIACVPEGECVSACPVAELDAQSGMGVSNRRPPTGRDQRGIPNGNTPVVRFHDTTERGFSDTGGASRFFPVFRYQAKAPARERPKVGNVAHPTVKPLQLMQFLVRLVTAPGGLVLDPFAGSGATLEACILESLHCLAIEKEAEYLPLIRARINRQSP